MLTILSRQVHTLAERKTPSRTMQPTSYLSRYLENNFNRKFCPYMFQQSCKNDEKVIFLTDECVCIVTNRQEISGQRTNGQLKFCFKTCVAVKFVDDDDDDELSTQVIVHCHTCDKSQITNSQKSFRTKSQSSL